MEETSEETEDKAKKEEAEEKTKDKKKKSKKSKPKSSSPEPVGIDDDPKDTQVVHILTVWWLLLYQPPTPTQPPHNVVILLDISVRGRDRSVWRKWRRSGQSRSGHTHLQCDRSGRESSGQESPRLSQETAGN